MKKIGLLLALVVFVSACKKENITPPIDLGEDPVFSVTGTVDGQSISFQGGIDGAYLETYTDVIHGVQRFSGRLTQGENYADFGVFDGNLFLPESNLGQAGTQLKLTLENTTEFIHIEKNSFSNYQQIQSIQISANGVDYGPKLTISEPGIYNICVTITYNDVNSTTTTICNDVILGYQDLAPFEVTNSVIQNGYLTAAINCLSTSISVNSVKWYLDNILISENASLTGLISTGVHHLKSVVTFSNGIVKTRTVGVHSGNNTLKLQDVNMFKTPISAALLQDFKAEFSIKLNGATYQHIGSSNSNQVVITGLSLYGKNAADKDVYKVSGTINCPMKNMSTGEISNAQFNVVFGVEIP